MEYLKDFTLLEMFWGGQTVLVGATALVQMLTGTYVDKESTTVNEGQKLGLLQFRKRVQPMYMVAMIMTGWTSWNVLGAYCFGREPSLRLTDILAEVASPSKLNVDSTSTLITAGLYLFHLMRRLYEGFAVSIFSQRQVVGPLQLVLGYSYYVGAALSIVAESPKFELVEGCIHPGHLNWYHLLGAGMFFLGTAIHHRAHRQLAQLRRNKSGHIVTTGYKMPKGGMFETVSSPHYLGEVLIYTSLAFTLGVRSRTWWFLASYVFTNQLVLSHGTHMMYKKKFDNYPTERKRLIPKLL